MKKGEKKEAEKMCSMNMTCIDVGADCFESGRVTRDNACFNDGKGEIAACPVNVCMTEGCHAYEPKEASHCRVYGKGTDAGKCEKFTAADGALELVDGDHSNEVGKEEEDGPTICADTDCPAFNDGEPNHCSSMENVYECDRACDKAKQDASASIPETPETASADETGVNLEGKQEGFIKELTVSVTPIQMGEYSLEMATLYRELKETEEDKKATAKSFADRITRFEVRLDEISKILTDGTIEKPIQCQWQYDFSHGVKRLIRLDNHTMVDERVLTTEEYQLDLNYQADQSVKNVGEAFTEQSTGEEAASETGEEGEEQGEVTAEEENAATSEIIDPVEEEGWGVGDPPDLAA